MKRILNKIIINTMIKEGKESLEKLDKICIDAQNYSEKLLMRIVKDNKNTEYGREYNFNEINSIADFKKKVPFSTYDDYAEAIERTIKKGEKNLISVYPTMHYAMTSGSVDNPKNIPVSQETIEIYNAYNTKLMMGVVDDFLQKTKGRSINKGRMFGVLDMKEQHVEDGTTRGPISAAAVKSLVKLIPYYLTTPLPVFMCQGNIDLKYPKIRFALQERNVPGMMSPFMTTLVDLMRYVEVNWEMIVKDIELGIIDPSIKIPDEVRKQLKLKPDKKRAAELRIEFEKGFDTPIIPRIWKNIDFISAIGTGGFSIYTDKMRYYSGDIPIFFFVYAASESLMAVATEMEKGEYVLLPQSGFYEFIPTDSEDDTDTKTLDQLEEGKDYEIVLTNLSGFYRYRIGDVVRCVGYHFESPKLCFVYRKNQMVSIAGEKTNEECIAWTVKEFAKKTGVDVLDFSVYADTDTSPGRYFLMMEPVEHLPKEKHEEFRAIIEEKLGIANPSVASKVKSGILSPTEIAFLQQETYYLYRDMMMMRGISENQLKPVRVIDTPVKEKFFFTLIDDE